MSRDSNGAHSLPAGNPVSSGTAISSTVHNATTADLSAEITDSLSRSGKGGMTAPLKGVDGSAAAPAVSFTSEPGTGLYRAGANNPAVAVSGTKRLECTSAGAAVTGTLGVSGDVAVATDKFTVAAASGNAAVAGTLGVTGLLTASGGLSFTYAAQAITSGLWFASAVAGFEPRSWKDGGGQVFLRGVLANTGSAGWSPGTLGTLPAGYRPVGASRTFYATYATGSDYRPIIVQIDPSGAITVPTQLPLPAAPSSSFELILDGITFPSF
jgi:hypothetical protein